MRKIFASIGKFFSFIGRAISIFRNIVLNIIFLAFLLLILFSFRGKEETIIYDNSALLLDIHGNIVEEKQEIDDLGEFINDTMGFSELPQETRLQDILKSINRAAEDNRISTIVLDLSDMQGASLNHLSDIGEALLDFRQTGKSVIAAEDFYSQSSYYLATYADTIIMNPMGVVDLHGLGIYRLYFNQALEKLRINYNIFRIGEYKSALEPITRDDMSEQAKSQNQLWLDSLWNDMSEGILNRRTVTQDSLYQYTNASSSLLAQTYGDTGQLALNIGLVDELKTRQELLGYMQNITNTSGKDDFQFIKMRKYLHTLKQSRLPAPSSPDGNYVGVIIAEGNIVPGEQPPGTIGSETMVELIRQAKNTDSIKAVVLRINSGGGSAFASEVIRQELLELKKKGKPLVVSMGAMAASGGYWIAADADEIFAYPTTLTGSIGIFGAIPTFERSLDYLGIHGDGTGTTKLATGLNISLPLSEELKKSIQLTIENGYNTFLGIVSNGRNIPGPKMDSIAQGRVFSGRAAQQNGLVDRLGNLEDALESAAQHADLDDYTVKYITRTEDFSKRFLQLLRTQFGHYAIKGNISGKFATIVQEMFSSEKDIMLFNDPRHIYAHSMLNINGLNK